MPIIDSRLSSFVNECEQVAKLKATLRTNTMIYQREDKVRAALRNGLPFNSYFELPYLDWERIRDSATNT